MLPIAKTKSRETVETEDYQDALIMERELGDILVDIRMMLNHIEVEYTNNSDVPLHTRLRLGCLHEIVYDSVYRMDRKFKALCRYIKDRDDGRFNVDFHQYMDMA